ncbi:MAG: oligosaccharide flippase family protein [Gemmatimonadales bacterium]|nr:oligosaccharide flippase family protein [Gemmatimonadales bacterium]
MGLNFSKSVKSAMQLLSANVGTKILGVLTLAFFARYLSKEELSILPVYEMMAALAAIFFGFGIHPTILRLLPDKLENEPEEARGLACTSGLILLIGSLCFSVSIFVLADRASLILFENIDFSQYLRILTLGFFFAANRNTTQYFLWASSRFDKLSVVRIVAAVGRTIFGVTLLLMNGLKGLAIGLVINEGICLFLSLYFLRDILFQGGIVWHSPSDIIKRSLPFYFESYLIYFRSQGDNWIVATMLGPAAISTYFVAKRLPQMLLMFRESVDKIVTSEISRRKSDPQGIRNYIHDLYGVLAHTATPFVWLLVGLLPSFIYVIAGREYSGAIIPGILLCFLQLNLFHSIPLGRGIFITRPPNTRVILTSIESVILIALLFTLSPILEESGVALSRLSASWLGLSISYFLMRKTLRIEIPWRQFMLSGLASGLMGGTILVLSFWRDSSIEVPIHALIGILVFLVFVSATNSRTFYATINRVAPFKVVDPVRFLIGCLAK